MDFTENDIIDFWDRIKKCCKTKNQTLQELYEKLNLPLQNMRNKRTRKVYPNLEEVLKIAKCLNVSVEYLITGHETQAQSVELEKAKTALHEIMLICQNASRTL